MKKISTLFPPFVLSGLFLWVCVDAPAQKKVTGRSEPVHFSISASGYTPVSGDVSELLAGQRVNVDSLPPAVPVRPHSVAIVIGVEQYRYLPPAPFASRDARLMERYFKTVLGVDKVVTYTDTSTSGFFFENLFDAAGGDLPRLITKGKTDLLVYYSGHGMHSANGDELFLLPADTKMNSIDRQGFSLNSLFEQLAALKAKSTTVFIDACFSGLGKFAHEERPVNLIPMKGIKVKPLLNQPWIDNPSFRVFTSSSDQQPSLVLGESRTGLFTYFLAAGLQGQADLDGDGRILMAELRRYIGTHVPEISRKIYQEQTPCFYGDENWVVYERKEGRGE